MAARNVNLDWQVFGNDHLRVCRGVIIKMQRLTPDSRKKGRKKQHFGGEINNKNFQFKSNRKTAYAL